jgi:hypothetical protein
VTTVTIVSRGALLSVEIWQFAGMLAFFVIALFLWFRIVYLPGRTLERWEDRRIQVKKEHRRPEDSPSRGPNS